MAYVLTHLYKKYVTRMVWMRITVLVSIALSIGFLIGVVTLMPAYVWVLHTVMDVNVMHTTLLDDDATGGQKNDRAEAAAALRLVREQLVELDERTMHMQTMVEATVRAQAALNSRITISRITYDYVDAPLIRISGVAANRDALIDFERALRKEIGFENAHVPISDLAGDTNLTFTASVEFTDSEHKTL